MRRQQLAAWHSNVIYSFLVL